MENNFTSVASRGWMAGWLVYWRLQAGSLLQLDAGTSQQFPFSSRGSCRVKREKVRLEWERIEGKQSTGCSESHLLMNKPYVMEILVSVTTYNASRFCRRDRKYVESRYENFISDERKSTFVCRR